jgi:putative nucleotidyltransferase with HDIG domain
MTLKTRLPQYLQYNDSLLLSLLFYDNPRDLKRIILKTIIYIYDNKEIFILEKPFENPLKLSTRNIAVRSLASSVETDEILATTDNLQTVSDLRKKIAKICYSIAPNLPRRTLTAVTQIISNTLRSNTVFNEEETKRRINETLNEVKPVTGILKKGQTIVRDGDTITMEALSKIRILNRFSERSNITYVIGVFLLQILFVFIFSFFLIGYSRRLVPDRKISIIILSLLSVFMVYTYFMGNSGEGVNSPLAFTLMLPIPFVTMMLSVLYNIYIAILVGLHTVFFTTMIHGGDFNTLILASSSAILGVFVNLNVQKRTDFLRGGFFIGLVNAILVVCISLIQDMPAVAGFKGVQLAFVNGIVNSILVLGMFPFYESVFGVTTKFKLLELADLNADIFKKMVVEAPGTYHHSLIVSNMAEAACKDIQADHLLARVGAFYHDIGKIEDAGMYIENKVTDPRARSLSPLEYSRLIISHVSKGEALAKKHRLPESVIAFIKEHHGKTTMTYFYHKALESLSDTEGGEIRKSDFEYPGPRPGTKETAVVMLADSIEAASRSLQEPSPMKLRGLVRKIIYNKLNEGELENTDLSMADLNRIQESFLIILNGVYHTRIEYPDSADVRKLEEKLGRGDNAESAG